MRGDKYVPGAILLAYTLRRAHVHADVICMVTADVTKTRLVACGFFSQVVEVPYIRHAAAMRTKKQREIYSSWIDDSFTKWNCLNIGAGAPAPRYEKICFVDADMMFRSSPDSVWRFNAPAAIFTLPWTTQRAGHAGVDPWVSHGRKKRISAEKLRAVMATGTSTVGAANFMLLEPNSGLFDKIRQILGRRATPYGGVCLSAPDEQVVAEASIELGMSWASLSPGYAAILRHPGWTAGLPIVGVHYISADKPWMFSRDKWPDFAEWWDAWESRGADAPR
jgi:hypothetical protein